MTKRKENSKYIFKGLKIYYFGSIHGTKEKYPHFAWKLVQYMKENGANVLSEHVAGRNINEMLKIRANKLGIDLKKMLEDKKPWFSARKVDLDWVNEATRLVFLVNGPSYGVGMEIQRAIDKPKLGMNNTPVLCLVHEDLENKLSFMLKGVTKKESPDFFIQTYKNLKEAN